MRVEGGVKAVEARARHEAKQLQQVPSTSHLLLVLLRRPGPVASLLASAGLRETGLLSALKVACDEPTSMLDRVVDRSRQLAARCGDAEPNEAHVLAALVADPRSNARQSMARLGVDVEGISESLRSYFRLTVDAPVAPAPAPTARVAQPSVLPPPRAPNRTEVARFARAMNPPKTLRAPATVVAPAPTSVVVPEAPVASNEAKPAARNVRVVKDRGDEQVALAPFELDPAKFPILTQLGRNLTALAARGAIDRVIGRELEVERLLDVLARRRSNNPVLVGPSGVGKTAVVEALAHRLVDGPNGVAGLEDRIVVELSSGTLATGTGVRGAMADRLKKLRAEVERSEGRVVLFLDEIHTLVSSGSDSPDDLANELKAAFARGELPCIGATTDVEYRKQFERDPALARRFSPVLVDEPSPETTVTMLDSAITAYEGHHRVSYERDAIRLAVELTVRFVPDRRLPDKAISALDHAGARVRRRGGTRVARQDVASVVAESVGLPVERLLLRDADRLIALESHLAAKVVGHGAHLERIADALRKGAAGFRGKKPLATFLFLGSTGVGKTETAKAISEVFFAGTSFTRIDMSELSEAHAVAKLFGAPPGYLGHEDGGLLTEAVRKRPYQLVLLDEIEKAHPDVLLSLLPILDEGRATDGKGRLVDFTNTVIVLTSNLGVAASETKARSIGFGSRADVAESADASGKGLEAARRAMPPELWNRIDEPLWFERLSRADVAEIARRALAAIAATMAREHGAELAFEPSAIDALIDAGGFDPSLGARPMRRTIARLVESRLASLVLEGSVVRGSRVALSGVDATIRVSIDEPALRFDAAE